jgi:DNA-binding NtrC family response regulator
MKNGAYDFLAKPFGLQELKLLLERFTIDFKGKVESRRLSERMKADKVSEISSGVRRRWTRSTA